MEVYTSDFKEGQLRGKEGWWHLVSKEKQSLQGYSLDVVAALDFIFT